MFAPSEDDESNIERALNQMREKGYRIVTYAETMDSQDKLYVMMIFEREQQPEKHNLLSEEMALDWTAVQPDYGDSILKREMAAARDDARPELDPLIKGLTR